MKVILLQELKGKGGEGDVVDVAPGFANNYLMPQGIAILATKGNLKQLEMRKNNIAKREATRLADADKLKSVLDGASVKVDAKVGEEGQLFGSVTATQIAEAIKAELGVEVDRKRVGRGHAAGQGTDHAQGDGAAVAGCPAVVRCGAAFGASAAGGKAEGQAAGQHHG